MRSLIPIVFAATLLAAIPACGGSAHARASEARMKANNNAVEIERLQRRVDALEKRLQQLEAAK